MSENHCQPWQPPTARHVSWNSPTHPCPAPWWNGILQSQAQMTSHSANALRWPGTTDHVEPPLSLSIPCASKDDAKITTKRTLALTQNGLTKMATHPGRVRDLSRVWPTQVRCSTLCGFVPLGSSPRLAILTVTARFENTWVTEWCNNASTQAPRNLGPHPNGGWLMQLPPKSHNRPSVEQLELCNGETWSCH